MNSSLDNVADVIERRTTVKVFSECDLPVVNNRASVDRLIGLAGWAPFHRSCDASHRNGELSGLEPWRFYGLDAADCRLLKKKIPSENAGKIPLMLAAAQSLVLATWLPNPCSQFQANSQFRDESCFAPTLANMEHIAAAAAAVENLLIAATADGITNYWSSGGVLRSPEVFRLAEIPEREILLGAIFLFPSNAIEQTTRVGSKMRAERSPAAGWMRWVSLAATQD
ncbi:MAG: hypothetical protein KDB03_15270 [Planctomycetales bacterium]|nr:hypothetical protein [Planctomycetales bacterium]